MPAKRSEKRRESARNGVVFKLRWGRKLSFGGEIQRSLNSLLMIPSSSTLTASWFTISPCNTAEALQTSSNGIHNYIVFFSLVVSIAMTAVQKIFDRHRYISAADHIRGPPQFIWIPPLAKWRLQIGFETPCGSRTTSCHVVVAGLLQEQWPRVVRHSNSVPPSMFPRNRIACQSRSKAPQHIRWTL